MIPRSALRSPAKEWTATLLLNGEEVAIAGALPRRRMGFSHARGTCTLATRDLPTAPAGSPAVVLLTLNGVHTTTFFTGRLDARPISDMPLSYEVGLVDSLARLAAPLPTDVVWSGRSFADAVRDLLDVAGIEAAERGPFFDPGADFALGPVEAVVVAAGQSIREVLQDLLTFGGCGLFVLPDGRLTLVDAPGWPGPTGATTLTYAFAAEGDELGILQARRTLVGTEDVVARFTAKGPRLESTKQIADATFTLLGVSGKEVTETYAFLQTDACAERIAAREIVRRNREATEVDVTVPLNPNLRHGESIRFRHPELGFSAATPAIVMDVMTSGDEMGITLSVGARPAEGDMSRIPPPQAAFSMRYEVQPIKLAGQIAVHTLVEATDASGDPSGFGLVERTWTATCAGNIAPAPETVTWRKEEDSKKQEPIPQPIFVFPTLEGASITLTVESASGEGATATQAVIPPTGEVFTRTISVASGATGWRVLDVAGWRSFEHTSACTAVPTINDNGPLLAGFADGAIFRTEDLLATTPPLAATISGSVTCMWVNEGNPEDVLAGAATTLYRSSSGGMAWVEVASFPDAVEYCENSPVNGNEISVCAGPSLFVSYDGATFTPLLTGPEGSRCRKVGSAPWGHLAVWSGTESLDDAWQFVQGHTIDWSLIPAEALPTDLASVTPLQYEAGYLVASGGASDMIRDGLFGQLGYLANLGVTQLYKLLPADGGGFVAHLGGETVDGGPCKILMASGNIFPIDVGDAHRIGYGQAVDPARPPQIVLLPSGQTGAADRIWVYDPELPGWRGLLPPLPSAAWEGIAISPFRSATHWLIWAGLHAYATDNGGQTWVQIYMPAPTGYGAWIYDAIFTGGDQWLLNALYFSAWGTSRSAQAYYVRGSGGTPSSSWSNGSSIVAPAPSGSFRLLTRLVRGANGEVFGHVSRAAQPYPAFDVEPPDAIATITGSTLTDGPETPYAPQTTTGPDTRAAYAVWSQNVAHTPDYRSVAPTPLTAAGGSIAVCEAGVVVGNREGVGLLVNLETAPAVQIVVGTGVAIGPVVAGSRGRGAGAVSVQATTQGQRTIFAHNGTQWATVLTPSGVSAVCLRMGLVER
ncbi:MAG: hypothetical protein EI684_05095 [Candidatus Viridilinea halotolerans]|uniref:Uncharacterized protein n=1 Tax=Candidatus Viridilinea halotolerans TaxID=2491704 RepID=A0A426U5Q7_9CHLR|nr:MAG: hypothetical protein EI684_05095 [Candidatus Viridilinea halotolerans]